jgi:sarcosine oxidase delta subunit
MMELNVTLDFFCCWCEQPVRVTVQCKGDGLGHEAQGAVSAVNVPCPTCGQVNRLLFEPSGQVRSVRPYTCFRLVPGPSVN